MMKMGTDEEVASTLNINKLMADENESVTSTNSTSSNVGNDIESSSESDGEDEMEESDLNNSESENDSEFQKTVGNGKKAALMGVSSNKSSVSKKENKPFKSSVMIKEALENVDDVTSEDESDEESVEVDSEHESSSDNEDTEKDNAISQKLQLIAAETSAETSIAIKEAIEEKSGWADAMAKVLNMGKNTAQTEPNKPLFLSKAIKDSEIKHRSAATSKELGNDNDSEEQKPPIIRSSIKRALKKEVEEKGRSKPDIVKDRSKEKILGKLATKGVVQLFNAVRDQQKSIKTQLNTVGGSVRKREKVYKNIDRQSFLNVLTNQISVGDEKVTNSNQILVQKSNISTNLKSVKRPRMESRNNEVKSEEDEIKEETLDIENCSATESTWNVFRDDFMMGAKMKDWDKEQSESDE